MTHSHSITFTWCDVYFVLSFFPYPLSKKWDVHVHCIDTHTHTQKAHSCLSWSKLYLSDCFFFCARLVGWVSRIDCKWWCVRAFVTALIITKTISDCILAIFIIKFLADGGMRECSRLKLWLATYVAITINKMHTSIIWLKWCYQWQWVPLESEIHTHTHTRWEHSNAMSTNPIQSNPMLMLMMMRP